MKNPYEVTDNAEQFALSRRAAWVLVTLFLLLLTVPPLHRNLNDAFNGEKKPPVEQLFDYQPESLWGAEDRASGKADEASLMEHSGTLIPRHLKQLESAIESASFTEPPRRHLQAVLTDWFREGNRKVVIGKDGWYYYRPGLDALVGYGPLKLEPDTVAKDPNRPGWRGPKDAILHFHKQLEGFGVELILMPIPIKPMIYPEYLTGTDEGPLRHADSEEFYEELRGAGIAVFDLTDTLWKGKAIGSLFLKQDTHWTPAGMELSAAALAEELKKRAWYPEGNLAEASVRKGRVEEAYKGDLVAKLELPDGSSVQPEDEVVEVEKFSGEPFRDTAEIVLLGDSFLNIYEDASLGFGKQGGFARTLANLLERPLDVIAVNGQGATGVRKQLADRRGSATLMKKKKVVVWAFAARDLFLAESIARETDVEWNNVSFNELEPKKDMESGELVVSARLALKSKIEDPLDTPYKDALYEAEYDVLDVLSGNLSEKRICVKHHMFTNQKMDPAASFQVGEVRKMKLIPFSEKSELKSLNGSTTEDSFMYPMYYEVPQNDEENGQMNSAKFSLVPTALTLGWVVFLVGAMVVVARRSDKDR